MLTAASDHRAPADLPAFLVAQHALEGAHHHGHPDPAYVAPGRDEVELTARVWTIHFPVRGLLEARLLPGRLLGWSEGPTVWGVLGGDSWAQWCEPPRLDGGLPAELLAAHVYVPAASEAAAAWAAVRLKALLALEVVLLSPAADWSQAVEVETVP